MSFALDVGDVFLFFERVKLFCVAWLIVYEIRLRDKVDVCTDMRAQGTECRPSRERS